MTITNMQRLKMDIQGIDLTDTDLTVYLLENNLKPNDMYDTSDKDNLRAIYDTALNILEGIANNPTLMRTIKMDDMSVSEFHDNLMKRIDQLENKIRNLKTDIANRNKSSVFMFYN